MITLITLITPIANNPNNPNKPLHPINPNINVGIIVIVPKSNSLPAGLPKAS